MPSDELFFVDEQAIVVRTHMLTVREILDDAGVDPADHALLEERDGSVAELSGLDTLVHLTQGMRFKTRRIHWRIFVNGTAIVTDSDVLTFDQVVSYAKGLPPKAPGVEYIVAFEKAAQEPHKGTLIENEMVLIKNGTEFEVSATNRS